MTVNDSILSQIREQLIPSESLEHVSNKFQLELKNRLKNSEKSMIIGGLIPQKPTIRPSEKSPNTFLVIDFGGSTLKFALISMPICEVVLQDGFNITDKFVDYKFFDAIITRISLKLNEHLAGEVQRPKFLVSITFSFPLNDKLEIITMSKGFEISPDIMHKSVKEIIASSFSRVLSNIPVQKFDVEVCNVINDSIAVYLTSKFMCKDESISLILGTGINSCFELGLEQVPPKKRPHNTLDNCHCLINVEAGFLGDDTINITNFDYHDDSERNMPLENVSSGKWMPITFANILNQYQIAGFGSTSINGELLVEIAENKYKGGLDDENLKLVQEISKLLIQRGAFYVVAMLLAVASFVNKDVDRNQSGKAAEVGYVGSFLEHSNYYKSQLALFSRNRIHFQFLHNSNLIGAAVATYLNKCN